jgi:hypothetical protein
MAASTNKFLPFALVAQLALSACDSGGSAARSYDSVRALAQHLGCSGVAIDEGAREAKEEGHCQLDGERVTVVIWPAGVDPQEPPGAASPFGGDWVVLGENWTVASVTAAGAKKVQDNLGGNLK